MTKEKILVVDVDRRSLAGVETLAEKAGIEACYAANAEDAWSVLMDGGVSLMLINPAIPGVSGHTLASMAKHLYSDITVVMMNDRMTKLCATNADGFRLVANRGSGSRVVESLPVGQEETRREAQL
jgi:DNA-binding response OmpR family regulator